jgi:ubiquinone/menaquinone biosynthesis C-methylase UbiE
MTPSDLGARDAWNAGADAYAHFVESGADYYRLLVHGPALLAACGDVRGLKALDVGCGQGYFSRLLARAGAVVTGIDVSDKLIARATEIEAQEPLAISYLRLDAERMGTHFDESSFDLIAGCMSLQDVNDPTAVLAAASRLLGRGGRAVFSMPHPCTDPPLREWKRDERGRKLALCLDRYFESGPAVCDWNMPRLKYAWRTPYHRFTLSEWSEMITDAGFLIRGLKEPRPDAALVAVHPQLDDCSRMPYFLIFELVKATSAV